MTKKGLSTDLPEFARPPVSEVAMGVHFEELAGFKIAHVGSVWSSFRTEYPELRDLDPLPPVMDLRRGQLFAEIRFGPRPPRTWFIDSERGRLIQLQPDRFVHNWRGSGSEYPRYEKLRREFDEVWSRFQGALGEVHISAPQLRHAELTYVNDIAYDEMGPAFMRAFSSPDLSVPGVRAGILDAQVSFRCLVEAVAPLHLGGFLDRGHAVIVHAFADVTTSAMHQRWGRVR